MRQIGKLIYQIITRGAHFNPESDQPCILNAAGLEAFTTFRTQEVNLRYSKALIDRVMETIQTPVVYPTAEVIIQQCDTQIAALETARRANNPPSPDLPRIKKQEAERNQLAEEQRIQAQRITIARAEQDKLLKEQLVLEQGLETEGVTPALYAATAEQLGSNLEQQKLIRQRLADATTAPTPILQRLTRTVNNRIAGIPFNLNKSQESIYQKILEVVHLRRAANQGPRHVVVISDLAKDYDDLSAMIVLKEFVRLGLIEIEGYVANLLPARERARFGRGALDTLGLTEVPIAVGEAASTEQHKVGPHEFSTCQFMAPEDAVFDEGQVLLTSIVERAAAENRKLSFLLLSSLTDISMFAASHPDDLGGVISEINMQGGYNVADGRTDTVDTNGAPIGTPVPDMAAANNNFDRPSTERFHAYIHGRKIPSTAYTKVATFATRIENGLFDQLGATGHPVGTHLQSIQRTQDKAFYIMACSDKKFRPFMDQEWYLKNKSSWWDTHDIKKHELPASVEEVEPFLNRITLYDALPAVAAGGQDLIDALGVLDPNPAFAADIHKVVGHAERQEVVTPAIPMVPARAAVPEVLATATSPAIPAVPAVPEQPAVREVTRTFVAASPDINGPRMAEVIGALMKGSLLACIQRLGNM